jgi:hypothetical protein
MRREHVSHAVADLSLTLQVARRMLCGVRTCAGGEASAYRCTQTRPMRAGPFPATDRRCPPGSARASCFGRLHEAVSASPGADVAGGARSSPSADGPRGEPSPGADVASGESSPGADVAAESRCRCGQGRARRSSPGAGLSPVQSRHPGADVAREDSSPGADVAAESGCRCGSPVGRCAVGARSRAGTVCSAVNRAERARIVWHSVNACKPLVQDREKNGAVE